MTEPIRLALGEHAADALNAAEALQTLMEEDQAKFVVSTAALRHEFDRPEFQPLMEVLARSTVVEDQLCDPDLIDKDHGVDLIRRIAAIAPGMEA
jgi:hypothetical protein